MVTPDPEGPDPLPRPTTLTRRVAPHPPQVRRAPNALWQVDHTQLDILIKDPSARPSRPWLTTVMDDYSRAICGYVVFEGAPSAMNTALALRQAIWPKSDPAWPMCGIPDVLYVDHGSDFTSHHLEYTAIALKIRIIHSTVARPQGRGKIERFFHTVNTEVLATLPGRLATVSSCTTPMARPWWRPTAPRSGTATTNATGSTGPPHSLGTAGVCGWFTTGCIGSTGLPSSTCTAPASSGSTECGSTPTTCG